MKTLREVQIHLQQIYYILQENLAWKSYRDQLHGCVDNLIRMVCDIKGTQCGSDTDDQTPCGVEGPVRDLVDQFDLRITQCVRDQLTRDQEEHSVIIIIDDNMYYSSMRYKYYQLARKCQYHYTNMRYKYYQLARKCQYHYTNMRYKYYQLARKCQYHYTNMRYKYYQLARKCQYHYTNMRYKYYQLARKCQYHFGIEFYIFIPPD